MASPPVGTPCYAAPPAQWAAMDVRPPPGLEAPRKPRPACLELRETESLARDDREPYKLVWSLGGGLMITGVAKSSPSPSGVSSALTSDTHSGSGSQTGEGTESLVSAEEEAPKRKKKTRFCKAKRDHYRKLVEQLVAEARANPESFSLDEARLPRAIAVCQESREKLLTTVMRFAFAEGPEL